jgi:cytosine/uracil/thiamine/allantoin permease
MSVNILTYMLAASLIQGGMNWKQAVATVFVGNTIVLIPMLLNSHPGTGGVITCFMGIALMPWKLLSSYSTFIFGWLGGYAAFLGPVAGIMICDYFVIRRRVLAVDDLYLRDGAYEYSGGFNWRALCALAVGAGTALVGLIVPPLRILYDYSWFVGFAVSFGAYYALMRLQGEPGIRAIEEVS